MPVARLMPKATQLNRSEGRHSVARVVFHGKRGELRQEGFDVRAEDVARLSPLIHDHIHMLGRYSLTIPEAVANGHLRPLRDPMAED